MAKKKIIPPKTLKREAKTATRQIKQVKKTSQEVIKQVSSIAKAFTKKVKQPKSLLKAQTKAPVVKKSQRIQTPKTLSGKGKVSSKSSKVTQKPPKTIPRKRAWTIRELPLSKRHKTLAGTLAQIDRDAPKLDKLLQRGEMWYATIFGHYTKRPFDSLSLLKRYFYERYEPLIKYGARPGKQEEVLDNIGIISFGNGKTVDQSKISKAYRKERDKRVAERVEREKTIEERIKQIFGPSPKKARIKMPPMPKSKPKGKTDKLYDLLEQSANVIEGLQKRIADLEKASKKANKKIGKVAKRVTSKGIKGRNGKGNKTVSKSAVKNAAKKI